MTLVRIDVADFRCIKAARLDLAEDCNLICGRNGSGKTSLLEAVAFLSRGRSFRGTRTDGLVRHGEKHFTISAVIRDGEHHHRMGIEAGRGHLEIRVNRQPAESLAALAEKLAVQVIDPEIHRLVSEGPEARRRFLDYGVFHVEHEFLMHWRRFRRALRQRNASLRSGAPMAVVQAWEPELIEAAVAVDACRDRHARELNAIFENLGSDLLDAEVGCEYRPGWGDGPDYRGALAQSQERDREQGTTTAGPHRADLRLRFRGRGARQQVSRGQQKLFGAGLILSQTRLLAEKLRRPPVLLIDDPAAELDNDSLNRLMAQVVDTESQLIVTALHEEAVNLPDIRVFHVEQGQVALKTS